MENVPETGEALLLKRTLLKPTKEVSELVQRRALFKTTCKERGKCCKVVIDSGSTDNLIFVEMVEKTRFGKMVHPTSYKVSWLHKNHHILVSEQCKVKFEIGGYFIFLC